MKSGSQLKGPSARYMGRNGFEEPPATPSQLQEAHEHALHVLKYYSVPPPSVSAITTQDWSRPEPETASSLKKQIDDLKTSHAKALAAVCDSNVSDFHLDLKMLNESTNELLDMEPSERKQSVNEVRGELAMDVDFAAAQETQLREGKAAQRLIRTKIPPRPFPIYSTSIRTRESANTIPNISRLRYTYLKRLIPLRKSHKLLSIREKDEAEQRQYDRKRHLEEAQRKEDEERRQKEAKFPLTPSEYKQKPVDYRRRIAKFLCLGASAKKNDRGLTPSQEKMMKDFRWVLEDVLPLVKTFETDAFFSSNVTAENISLQETTRDPRRA
ncbi:hypothetical protein AAF712_004564 [Marasmius tenuissimus]|uniref:Uncharacterized protein n=1 Tax=Marasmius tenuissimus TaxID=585030 RepID=A0ABR3A3M9_9AGAR|nr:hypothetical protein PM082_003763 [Marasmius tenuissimus]